MRLLNVVILALILVFIGQQVSAANVVGTAMYESATLWGREAARKPLEPMCSGVVLWSSNEQTIVATARHCLEAGIETVHFYDGDVGVVQAHRFSTTADVALLLVASKRHAVAPTSNGVSEGDTLFVIGAPTGESWSYSSAHSRSGDRYDPAVNMPEYEMDCASCFFGDSGAPVFNLRGQVVGIDNLGGALNYPAVEDFVPIRFATALLP